MNSSKYLEEFNKYLKFSNSIVYFNELEFKENENDDLKNFFEQINVEAFNDTNFRNIVNQNNKELIYNYLEKFSISKGYKEKNSYILELMKISNKSYIELRNLENFKIVSFDNSLLSELEINNFLKIYNEHLNYINEVHYNSFFKKFSPYSVLIYSILILQVINIILEEKQKEEFILIEEELNNYFQSFGIYFFNKIPYDKKRIILKEIFSLLRNRGKISCIEKIASFFYDEFDFLMLYLVFDNKKNDYYFVGLKENESIYDKNINLSERIFEYDLVTSSDNSWNLTKEDLPKLNVNFIKTKYFTIVEKEKNKVVSSELGFQVFMNYLIDYKKHYNGEFFIFCQFIPEIAKIDLVDFLYFFLLIRMRKDFNTVEEIKQQLFFNEKLIDKTVVKVTNINGNIKTLDKIINEISIFISKYERDFLFYQKNLIEFEKEEFGLLDYPSESFYTRRSELLKNIENNFYGNMSDFSELTKNEKFIYVYLINKYPEIEKYLNYSQELSSDLFENLLLYFENLMKVFNKTNLEINLEKVQKTQDVLQLLINFFKPKFSYFVFLNELTKVFEDKIQLIESYCLKGLFNFNDYIFSKSSESLTLIYNDSSVIDPELPDDKPYTGGETNSNTNEENNSNLNDLYENVDKPPNGESNSEEKVILNDNDLNTSPKTIENNTSDFFNNDPNTSPKTTENNTGDFFNNETDSRIIQSDIYDNFDENIKEFVEKYPYLKDNYFPEVISPSLYSENYIRRNYRVKFNNSYKYLNTEIGESEILYHNKHNFISNENVVIINSSNEVVIDSKQKKKRNQFINYFNFNKVRNNIDPNLNSIYNFDDLCDYENSLKNYQYFSNYGRIRMNVKKLNNFLEKYKNEI